MRLACWTVTVFSMREAAELLGVSDDTVRRWADSGRIATTTTAGGRAGIEGSVLAVAAQSMADDPDPGAAVKQSARNRMRGIVTRVVRDTVMAQVEMQAGPFRIVSLMSREAADDLGLEPGVLAVAAVKSTNVVVEIPGSRS
jgi:molybdopterin-binding protein